MDKDARIYMKPMDHKYFHKFLFLFDVVITEIMRYYHRFVKFWKRFFNHEMFLNILEIISKDFLKFFSKLNGIN